MEYIHAEFIERQKARKDNPIVVDVSAAGRHADLVFVITEIENYDPAYDYLGDWKKDADEWTINRKRGVLYGKFREDTFSGHAGDDPELREKAELDLLKRAEAAGYDLEDPHTEQFWSSWWDDELLTNVVSLEVQGYQIIQTGKKAFVDRHAYEYFQPQYLYGGPNLEVDPQSIEKGIEDWWRMERMEQGYWYLALMEGILYFRGYEVASVTMDWESDYVWSHLDEIKKAMLADLEIDTKLLDRRVHELEDEIAALTNFSPDLLKDGAGK